MEFILVLINDDNELFSLFSFLIKKFDSKDIKQTDLAQFNINKCAFEILQTYFGF